MNSNNQSFFIEEVSQYDIIDESYSIMYKDMRNWHNLQLAIYECVLNEGNIINFIKDIIHKIIETLKKWWKNITDFIKKVINNGKSRKMAEFKWELKETRITDVTVKVPQYFKLYYTSDKLLYEELYDFMMDELQLEDVFEKVLYVSDSDDDNINKIKEYIDSKKNLIRDNGQTFFSDALSGTVNFNIQDFTKFTDLVDKKLKKENDILNTIGIGIKTTISKIEQKINTRKSSSTNEEYIKVLEELAKFISSTTTYLTKSLVNAEKAIDTLYNTYTNIYTDLLFNNHDV